MKMSRRSGIATVVVVAAIAAAPAGATTLIRASLDDLVATNSTIVVGEALDARSYWNAEGTFILTDVRLAVSEVLKGRVEDRELTVTLLGGVVEDEGVLVVGGAALLAGKSYVLFLTEGDLAGVQGLRAPRDHSQGVFEVTRGTDGRRRAVSQAHRQPLVPDARGEAAVPGGAEGLELSAMMRAVRDLAARQAGAAGRTR